MAVGWCCLDARGEVLRGEGSGVAERLYYDSAGLKFSARVADIRLVANERGEGGEREQLWQVALDRTAFYPEGGGQPWDTGVLVATARSGAVLEVAVERVEEDEAGEVWHFVRKPLVDGTEVEGRVDAARRMDHAQQHSGQHLLSAVFLKQLGARTVSFHLGVETSTIDLALASGATGLSAEEVVGVEEEVNRLVFEDRAMRPLWYSREEAEAMLARGELRKLPERTGAMRVVEMEGVEWNACGGTHVRSTGAIGGVMVRRLEKVKSGWRVEFVCGLRAVRLARREFAVLSGVAGKLSVGWADVPGRVAALGEENKAAAKAAKALMEELAEAKAAALLGGAGEAVTAVFAGKHVEFAKRVASVVARAGRKAVIGVTEGVQGSVVLALPHGDGRNAGMVLRENGAEYGMRGGGSNELAQGVLPATRLREAIAHLASLLEA